jgi:hypothetical protein
MKLGGILARLCCMGEFIYNFYPQYLGERSPTYLYITQRKKAIITDYLLPITYYLLSLTDYRLPITDYLTPIDYLTVRI